MADSPQPASGSADRRPRWPLLAFCALLLVHAGLTTRNWHAGFLAGHEFRQTQTALSILFIERNHDYALAYPTPLFGPPWSIPMEFPLYQWTVARLGTATGWTLPVAGRTVTLACFYLTLPALFWLLGELGLDRTTRWLALSLVVAAPVYVFFSRALLIESMALMGSVWFLAAFARLCRTPRITWLLLAAVAGTTATLVKVTTFMPWCAAAAVIGLRWSWQEWRQRGLSAWRRTVGWGLACAAAPGLATVWWVHWADGIKAASPGGQALESGELSEVNFGTWHDRVSPESLAALWRHGDRAVGPWWLLLGMLAVGFALHPRRRQACAVLLPLGLFFGTLATFPVLYHRHDYYFYAIAVLPLVALAMILAPLAQGARHRWIPFLSLLAIVGGQLAGYARDYAPLQQVKSNGGSGLSNALRDMLPLDGVLVIAGQDWAPVLPYYSQRRALMLRENISANAAARARYFAAAGDAPVAALVLFGAERANQDLVTAASRRFNLDASVTIADESADVYVSRELRNAVLMRLIDHPDYSGVEPRGALPPPPPPEPTLADGQVHAVSAAQAAQLFGLIRPAPYQYRCKFGFEIGHFENAPVIGAHPETDLWIKPSAGALSLTARFGMQPGSYANPQDGTDGVVFTIAAIRSDGREEILWSRYLTPLTADTDRSLQSVTIDLPAGVATVRCSTQRGATYNFDWAFWAGIEIR